MPSTFNTPADYFIRKPTEQDARGFYKSPSFEPIGIDLTNSTPAQGVNNAAVRTAEISLEANLTSVVSSPFDITIDTSAGTFTLVTGTVNGIVPNNINNTFTIATVGTRYVYITCSAINGVLTGCTINVGSSQPAPIGTNIGYPQNSFNIPIYVVVNGTAFRVINRTSLQVLSKEAFRVQKSMFTPDTLPYDSYYTWSVSDV